jgi:hypothetical protein
MILCVGAHYGSIHLRTSDRGSLLPLLTRFASWRKLRLYVSPAVNGWTAIYPSENGQDFRVSAALAKQLDCDVLHTLVHDSDVFAYTFYRDHSTLDEYDSIPDYFGAATAAKRMQWQAHPERYENVFPADATLEQLRNLLIQRPPNPKDPRNLVIADAEEALEQFASILKLPPVLTAYEYLQDGETQDIADFDQFIHIPDRAKLRAKSSKEQRAMEAEYDRLRVAGLLLAHYRAPASVTQIPRHPEIQFPPQPRVASDPRPGGGFIALWGVFNADPATMIEMIQPPFTQSPLPISLRPSPNAHTIAVSSSGRYLACGNASGDWSADLFDLQTLKRLINIPHHRAVQSLQFSQNESRLVSRSSGGDVVVTSVPDGKELFRADILNGGVCGIHRDGSHIVLDDREFIRVIDIGTGEPVRLQRPGAFTEPPVIIDFEKLSEREQTYTQQAIDVDLSCNAERITDLTFTSDGMRLVVASNRGVRVYDWKSMLDSIGSIELVPVAQVAAHWKFSLGTFANVYTIFHDAPADRILFAGIQGDIRALDLSNNQTTTLLALPGRPSILQIALAPDRAALATVSQRQHKEIRRQHEVPWDLNLWRYSSLKDD